MRKSSKSADPSTEFLPGTISPKLWQSALRCALDADGASGRCSRRDCRSEDLCHLEWKKNKPLHCGGGITDATLQEAARLALFGYMVWPGAGYEGI